MVIGYVVARMKDGKVAGISGPVGNTPEEGAALQIAARIEYPNSFANGIVVRLEVDAELEAVNG